MRPTKTSTLQLIKGLLALEEQMKDQGMINSETLRQWLADEKVYLQRLSHEPLQETLQMEYYQKLVNLEASQKVLDETQSKWLVTTPETYNAHNYTQSIEIEH
ncbi:hypothetical protein C0995_007378 [Termitomyces sp. Mi166|nr:hypothetical protein C0995_007378 [Termitomyces sp. Mi166\